MVDKCPYCGAAITTSLKFCVSCRRSVTEGNIRGLNQQEETERGFKLSKREYSFHRQVRTFFFGLSSILMLLLVFVCSMKFIVKKPIPGEAEITKFIKQLNK